MGDGEFAQATVRHREWLFTLARRMTRSRPEAEDAVQETYLLALRGWRRHRPERVLPWLVAILRNVVRSQHRRRLSRPPEELAPDPDDSLRSPVDTAEEALSRLTGTAVRHALWQLPPAQREAIVLTDMCGLTAMAAGELVGAPRGTVLARVHRGRRRLAELLREELPGRVHPAGQSASAVQPWS